MQKETLQIRINCEVSWQWEQIMEFPECEKWDQSKIVKSTSE